VKFEMKDEPVLIAPAFYLPMFPIKALGFKWALARCS